MTADRDIDEWLQRRGFASVQATATARATLEFAQLTRAGKRRISDQKLPKVEALLAQAFFLHCESAACVQRARGSGRTPVATPKATCEGCGGSDNHRAESDFVACCQRHRVTRVLVVGGSPSVRQELESQLGSKLELRMVDGTERRTGDRAKSDLEWAQLVLIWGASELHHKVSTLYTGAPPPVRKKVVTVNKRGVAALLSAGAQHLDGKAAG